LQTEQVIEESDDFESVDLSEEERLRDLEEAKANEDENVSSFLFLV